MPDIEPIKGKVIIEYDGSGVAEAKKDLSSLADIVGGSLSESTGAANDALATLDGQMGKSAESTASLTSSVTALAKPMQASGDAITTVSEALAEHQSAVEDAGTAYEGLKQPIEDTTALLPQFASSLHEVSKEFDPRAFGLDTFNENFAVFQDALQNPYPFQMIHQYLGETGQTWDDFSSSIGDSNAAFLDQMAAMPVTSSKAFDAMSSGVQNVGQSFVSAAGDTEAFNKQWNDVAASIGEVGQAGGVGTVLLGPAESWSKLDSSLASVKAGMNEFGGVGASAYGPVLAGEAGSQSLGEALSGAMGSFDSFMRPLMYAQMAGMMIGQVSTGIYNMAALAEGPAAHSLGTFTGAVDQLTQSTKSFGEQFSENFGQGLQPMLDAMNNQAATSGSDGGFLGGTEKFLGGVLSVAGDIAQILTGADLPGGINMAQSGWKGLANTSAQLLGFQSPYPTPSVPASAQIDLAAIQTSMAQSIAMMNAQANSPGYLAAQAFASSQGNYAAVGQAEYNASHMTVSGIDPTTGLPTSYTRSAFDYSPQAYQQSFWPQVLASGGVGMAGMSDVDLNQLYFEAAGARAAAAEQPPSGCFPAGTPVLLADGTEQAIETLQVGARVLAHDGEKQVRAVVRDRMAYFDKHIYTLAFSDGNTLTLTNSHPVSTPQGWKSLSPEATEQENPGLPVIPLLVGDTIHTQHGSCVLMDITPIAEATTVYNITVDGTHTYYASGVLVHNAKLSIGAQVQQNVANTEVPQMDMKNSNLIQSMMGNFTSVDLTHTFTASVSWATTGDLAHTFQGAASWIGQNLLNTFEGAASWIGNNLLNTFTGDASWLGNNLKNTFLGDASWIGQGLTNIFTGVASWVSSGGLEHTFQGVADWIGQNLEHTFTAVASWVTSGLSQTASVPGFAAGVQNFSGGLAVVGEYGPELIHMPQGTNVYPQSAIGSSDSFSSLFSMMGNNTPASGGGDLHVHFYVGSKEIAHEILPQMAPVLRSQMGVRR